MRPYIVRQGDYLTKIAWWCGEPNASIWDAPRNRELRNARGSGEILAPGDILHVPDAPRSPLDVAQGRENAFVARVDAVRIKVQLLDGDDRPYANVKYLVEDGTRHEEVATDGDGVLQLDVPVTVGSVRASAADGTHACEISIGHMNPLDTDSGRLMRLCNLGFIQDPDGADAWLAEHGDVLRERLGVGVEDDLWAKVEKAHGG